MPDVAHFLFTRTWWTYDPAGDAFGQAYHWMNLVEGSAWLVFAAVVFGRHARHRHSPIELLYGLAFVTFGLSDFREAHALESWLILFKGLNLFALLYLRRLDIRRFYPQSKTF